MKPSPKSQIHWSDWPALALFVVLGLTVSLQFVSRYVFNDSVAWTEEVARYLLIGVAYFGSLMAIRRGGHIFLEVIYRRTTAANVKALALLSDMAIVVFNAVLTILAFQLTLAADRRMISVDLPKSIVYGVVTVALAAGTIVAFQHFLRRVRSDAETIREEIEQSAAGENTE